MEASWLRTVEEGLEVDLWVVPGATRTGLAGLHGGALRVRVAAPPERGKANKAVVQLLAELTGGATEIVRGHRSRRKTVLIRGAARSEVLQKLGIVGSG